MATENLRAEIGRSEVTRKTQVVDGVETTSVGGTLRVRHGYSGRGSPDFNPDYDGPRYPEGNEFGDGGVYLDGDGKWTSNDPYQMMFETERVAEVEVTFDNALIVSPDTVRDVARAAGKGPGPTTGTEISEWAKTNGFDGVIVTGFDKAQADIVGEIPDKYMGDNPEINARFQAVDDMAKGLGISDSVAQDQVIAFKPENLTVVKDGVPHGSALEPVSSQIDPKANDFDVSITTDDGRTLTTASEVLDYLDEGDEFADVIALCGKKPKGNMA